MLAPGFLRARVLRYWVCLQLLAANGRPVAVDQLVAVLEAQELRVKGRPSKAISDCLRWATSRGWARRMERGTYRSGRIPESTVRYMREVVHRARFVGDPVVANTLAWGRPEGPPS